MSVNHLHIPASLFLLLSRVSVTAAAVDIRGQMEKKGGYCILCTVYIIQRKRRNRINSMSVNHLHIPVTSFLLLSRGSITAAAVEIRGRWWQVANGKWQMASGDDSGRKRENSRS